MDGADEADTADANDGKSDKDTDRGRGADGDDLQDDDARVELEECNDDDDDDENYDGDYKIIDYDRSSVGDGRDNDREPIGLQSYIEIVAPHTLLSAIDPPKRCLGKDLHDLPTRNPKPCKLEGCRTP